MGVGGWPGGVSGGVRGEGWPLGCVYRVMKA